MVGNYGRETRKTGLVCGNLRTDVLLKKLERVAKGKEGNVLRRKLESHLRNAE